MAGIKGTRYGQARRAAYALWRGPDFAQQQSQTEALGGNRVLSLAIRKGSSLAPLLESRSVYGSLVSDRSSDAILRAVSWNSQTARHPSTAMVEKIRWSAYYPLIGSTNRRSIANLLTPHRSRCCL